MQEIWDTGNRFIAANLRSTFLLNLRISMASFLQKHSGDDQFQEYCECFKQAIITITPYWENEVFDPLY